MWERWRTALCPITLIFKSALFQFLHIKVSWLIIHGMIQPVKTGCDVICGSEGENSHGDVRSYSFLTSYAVQFGGNKRITPLFHIGSADYYIESRGGGSFHFSSLCPLISSPRDKLIVILKDVSTPWTHLEERGKKRPVWRALREDALVYLISPVSWKGCDTQYDLSTMSQSRRPQMFL